MSHLIKNAVGTSDDQDPQGNLNCWEDFFNVKADKCSVEKCPETKLVGAHVTKMFGNDQKTKYIIPMCRDHNNQFGGQLLVYEDTKFMPADQLG